MTLTACTQACGGFFKESTRQIAVREQKLNIFERNGCWKFLMENRTQQIFNLHALRIKLPKKRTFSLSFVAGVITQVVKPWFRFRLSFFFFSSFSQKSPSGLLSACVTSACVRHMEFTEVVVVVKS